MLLTHPHPTVHTLRILGIFVAGLLSAATVRAEKLSVAAAADLKFALDTLIGDYLGAHPQDQISAVYGSSGKFQAQIEQGAPFDLFLSADIAFPQALADKGLAASPVVPYAVGRLVIWSNQLDVSKWTLADLDSPKIEHVAIANPQHAPYGKRAEEALRKAGVWEKLQPKIVLGENIAQTAQFVQSGNAQIGLIAYSLALSPELSREGHFVLVPSELHRPLKQAFIITKRAADSALAKDFAAFLVSTRAQETLKRFGFEFPASPSQPAP